MAKQLTVLERVEKLEKDMGDVGASLDLTVNQTRSTLASSMEVLDALLSIMVEQFPDAGLEAKLQARIEKKRDERLAARVEQEKKQLESMVEAGVLKVSDAITEKSVLVARLFDVDGNVKAPGRQQLEFSQLVPAVKDKFLGQGVGFVFEAETKERLEVLEVYEIVPQEAKKEAPAAPPQLAAVPPPVAQ